MGGSISSLFGGGQSPSIDVPSLSPTPLREELDPVSKSVREVEQRRIKAMRAMAGTLLTGKGPGQQVLNSLLGRSE